MSLLRSSGSIALWTGVSRALGMAREIAVARFIGQNDVSDAFVVAFRIPNLFRRLFGEGALNAAFVPLFGKELENGRAAAEQFARRTFCLLALLMLGITAVLVLASPQVVGLLAPGYRDQALLVQVLGADGRLELVPAGRTAVGSFAEIAASPGSKFRLTVELARICAAYSAFLCLAALASGVLNTLRSFAVPAATPILLNVLMIGGLVAGAALGAPVIWLAWSVFIAGLAQLGIVWLACWRRGIRLLPQLEAPSAGQPKTRLFGLWTPRISRLALLTGPGLLGAAAQQLGAVFTTGIASAESSGNSYLTNGDRLQQLPLGMIGIAIGTALLPSLNRHLALGQHEAAARQFRQGLSFAAMLTLPAAIALAALGPLIFTALYEGDQFQARDSRLAGAALRWFALGMPLWVAVKVFLPGYYARENTRTPLLFSLATLAVNLLLAWSLFPRMGAMSIAAASSAAALVNAGLLWRGLRHDRELTLDRATAARIVGFLLVSLTMGAFLLLGLQLLDPFIRRGPWPARAGLAVLIAAGGALYAALIVITRLFTLAELRAALRREPGPPVPPQPS